MRRLASLGFLLAMTGCQYVGSPFEGAGGFLADTHTLYRNPNKPIGDSDNMRRVQGLSATSEPLVPEPGNVWPGPLPPDLTLQDIERANPDVLKPGDEMNLRGPRGSGTPPGLFQPNPSNTPSVATPSLGPQPTPPQQASPRAPVVQTPGGPAVLNSNGGVQTYTAPGGSTGIVVPNGNGTSTLIAPDGSVQTVPSPR